ncbi:MAG TPA: DUF4097 family beta strand repeat-containing protein [Terriglobales bacterium]|nr:DUF4097 family beta strand repeat-containing protein [Terriglobales bacterium]
MASTMQAPPPPQAPPPRYRRSLSGPIVLISIGIVFLLGTMGYLDWQRLGHWFAHYWPVILIVAGVIKLIEYQTAQRQGYRPRGLGAGGIFLIILVVTFGLIATQMSRFDWNELKDNLNIDDNDFNLFGEKYTYEDQLSQAFPAGASLHVNDTRGAVTIDPSNDDQIHVVVHKRVNADNQSEADKYNGQTKPSITVSGNIVTLNANNDASGEHHVAVDLEISMPRAASVNISNRYGDVNVTGRDGDVVVAAQHNDVTASDINGKVSLNLEHSSAKISQVSSDVSIEGRASDVAIDDVKGGLHLDGEFMESVRLSKIAQTVNFKSARTDLQFSKLDGDLNLDSGDLQADNVSGPVRLTTRSKDIRLSGVSGDVRVQDENGSIELRMNKLGSMQVENRNGDIQIYLPEKAGFQLDARSRGGEIETDFNELKIDSSGDTAVAAGVVGGGGPRIVLTNNEGTIEIRKHEPEPPKPPKAPKAPRAAGAPTVTEN